MLIQTYLDTRKQGTLKLESWKFELGSWKSLTRHQGSPPQLKQLLQPCYGKKSISHPSAVQSVALHSNNTLRRSLVWLEKK